MHFLLFFSILVKYKLGFVCHCMSVWLSPMHKYTGKGFCQVCLIRLNFSVYMLDFAITHILIKSTILTLNDYENKKMGFHRKAFVCLFLCVCARLCKCFPFQQ